jgi:hypothetical protein
MQYKMSCHDLLIEKNMCHVDMNKVTYVYNIDIDINIDMRKVSMCPKVIFCYNSYM